ncbi:MAG: hypothetical protein EXR86_02185 [Gammaproteobacteria bacterium]|nr:hypothetical protein [Gammaproteobacteria bacterium]
MANHRIVVENLRRDGAKILQRRQADLRYNLRLTSKGVVHADTEGSPPSLIVPNAPFIGQRWEVNSELALVESRTFAAQDRLRGRHLWLPLTARVDGFNETISIPAGSFAGCLRLTLTGQRTVRIDRGNAYAEVVVTQKEWYAPAVGLVKLVRTERSTSRFLRDGLYRQQLLEFGD